MTQQLILAFAADHAGYSMKQDLIAWAQELTHSILDFGTHNHEPVDYPDFVLPVVNAVLENKANFGVLICGSGVGMDITANRYPKIRAALCHCELIAQRARRHNDANILCLGAQFIGPLVARECLRRFIETSFEGGRHQARLTKFS